ncbi:acyltransferase family protein [Biformimicrobium ophioploci]|uniref:Heparan-alpha-glucosaminide N-acetyltransferase domain-containing protein n=1 Tax=Biformimicrobium ophioploci TaxID=3036711 RepID=A0ABQ6M0U4_9GAMM|nr:heparan-alpha-glucosaminide N-acetyltransferase domain-containing protein [Microbulbifer sp. NKW57]GMG87919.1 heparan-alpha-glucosaminide N-acetyltransferase domain-containing protein [Microbulbifer sp. NKW57]
MLQTITRYLDSITRSLPAGRLQSVDAFRGMAVMGMILVNNPGSWSYVYPPLLHAEWHGWTVTDLIFPFFLFIVGVSLNLSLGGLQGRALPEGIYRKIGVRALKLYGLGLFLVLFYYNFADPNFNWFEDKLGRVRIMGVLQRIGLVFFLGALLVLHLRRTQLAVTAVGLMAVYWACMMLVPYTDDAGNTYVGLLEKGNSFAAWMDHVVLGADHNYYRSTEPFTFDPEGLFSTLPALASCLLGAIAGSFLQNTTTAGMRNLAIGGAVLAIVGQLSAHWIPINKALWTPSFVLLTAGLAAMALAACVWLIDLRGYRRWSALFVVCGVNAIAIYMFSGVMARILMMARVGETSAKGWFFESVYAPAFGQYFGSLLFALSFLVIGYLLMDWMFRRRIFWKV